MLLTNGVHPDRDRPALIVCNHSCVLDSALAIELSCRWERDWKVWASSDVIDRYGWFYGRSYTAAGRSPAGVARSISELAAFLKNERSSAVWTFPQGDHVHPAEPVVFLRGIEYLLRAAGDVDVYALGIAYCMYRQDKPVASVVLRRVEPSPTAKYLAAEVDTARKEAGDQILALEDQIVKRFHQT